MSLRVRTSELTASSSRGTDVLAVHTPRPQRRGEDQVYQDGEERADIVPYSTPSTGFMGYTFEVSEALKDMRHQREVKGGLIGPLRAAAELERAEQQRNEAFRRWLSDVMKREIQVAKRATFTVLKRHDQMLQEVGPDWFQQLSWDQMETVNQLQAAHRADSEESGAARIATWCSRLGITPVPSTRQITRALLEQPMNHEAFLLALYSILSRSGKAPAPGDPPPPKLRTGFEYTPSERLLLSALAHLRLPSIVSKLEEEFGAPEKRPRYLSINPEVPARTRCSGRYLWPYLEPLPVPQMDWLGLFSANHTVHVENLYMHSHRLPPTLIKELQPKPLQQVTVPETRKPIIRRRRRKGTKQIPEEDLPTGVPPGDKKPTASVSGGEDVAETPSRSAGSVRLGGRGGGGGRRPPMRTPRSVSETQTRSVALSPMRAPTKKTPGGKQRAASEDDEKAPGVDPASVESFLQSLEDPLCQLPDVHKIPAIQKWVRLRNGLLYVHRKLAEVLQDRSLIMWNANHLGQSYRVPSPKHGLSCKQVRELTWDRREWFRRRVNRRMQDYYTDLRRIQVNATREMFPAMACDFFPNRDKFLKTYFAYMPKHEMDTIVVKPWAGEYNQAIMRTWRNRYYQSRKK